MLSYFTARETIPKWVNRPEFPGGNIEKEVREESHSALEVKFSYRC